MPEETLSSLYSFDKETLDAYYNSQFESMELEWLDDIRQWIRDTYHVNVMTIAYRLFWNDTHRFTVYLRYRDENIPMVSYSDNKYEYHIPEIEERIAQYFEVKGNETIRCMRCAPHQTFEGRAKEYLLLKKAYDFRREIVALFDHLSPARICYGSPVECVLETREEAKAFLLSEDHSKIRKQIFDILKPYDDYNALTLEDIRIFVDYREHMEGIPMYGRWISDLSGDDFERYENSLINEE